MCPFLSREKSCEISSHGGLLCVSAGQRFHFSSISKINYEEGKAHEKAMECNGERNPA